MNKLKPDTVIGSLMTKGIFQDLEAFRHRDPDQIFSGLQFAPINVKRFGEYFRKCIGNINSIVKRGEFEAGDYQMVVKQRIGYRNTARTQGYGNARYADDTTLFAVLHPIHMPLICKKAKREIAQDFLALKQDFIIRFHNLKAQALGFVDDQVAVSDAFVVGSKKPDDGTWAYEELGYMLLNSRVIPKDKVFITIDQNYDYFEAHTKSIVASTGHGYARSNVGELCYTVFIDESEGDCVQNTTLFSVRMNGTSQEDVTRIPTLNVFDTRFNGIDVSGMTDFLANALENLNKDFEAELETLKNKYLGEFLLHEICESEDGAI